MNKSKVIKRVFIIFGIFILCTAVFMYGVIYMTYKGPSKTITSEAVVESSKTNFGSFISHLFLSDEEIDNIVKNYENEGAE